MMIYPYNIGSNLYTSFQSIGVTKDWRRELEGCEIIVQNGFQSIGVTKDWRRPPALFS